MSEMLLRDIADYCRRAGMAEFDLWPPRGQ